MCNIFQIDSLKFLIDNWTALSRPFRYLGDPKPRIIQLSKAMIKLRSVCEDVNNRIRLAELDGLSPTNEVRVWLDEVAAIGAEVSQIQTDLENGSFRWCINRRVAHKLAEVSVLGETKTFFDNFATKLPPKGVQEVPVEPLTATQTMVPYLSQLQAFLQDNGSHIMGIWGMGGVGKTTLLGNLNNELCSSKAGQTPPMFDHVIWAVASKDYNIGKLLQDIAKQLGLPLHTDKEMRMRVIMEFLRNKSFLLLLDDVWKSIDLTDLGIPQFHRPVAMKQKVVLTTRSEDVCGQMQARCMKIECLNDEEAWRIFKDKVGEDTLQEHARIPLLAREVARECDGLPLALVTIGSAMRLKKTPQEWQNAITLLQNSRLNEIQGTCDKILPKLKFSYENLPNEIFRRCFLLCSLWLEDFSIYKSDLIECWMGHGLVDESNFYDINQAFDSGHALIGGLQAACLLEPGDDKDLQVKMHDVVRDLALWIASDCGEKPNRFIVCSGINASQGEVERISLNGPGDLSDTSSLPSNCSKMETLIIRKNYSFRSIVTGFFHRTPALAYLDISFTEISDLPQEIGELVNLRYLNISVTKISRLPVELGNLRKLRFLLLIWLKCIDIPIGLLEKLEMLSVIDMTYTRCDNWKELSKVPGRLKGVGILLESIEDLCQLVQFPNVLTWRLGLKKLVGFNEPLQLGSRNIRSSIQILTIESCQSLEVVSMTSDDDDNTKTQYLSSLYKLELLSLPNLKEIVWRGVSPLEMLLSLTVLIISKCHNLSNISWVIRLLSLKYLAVLCFKNMKQIVDDDNENEAFTSLKWLKFENLKSLRVFGGSFTFPSLELLQVFNCPKMKALPFGKEMAGRKLKEIFGGRQWWEKLDMEDDDRAALRPYFKEDTCFYF